MNQQKHSKELMTDEVIRGVSILIIAVFAIGLLVGYGIVKTRMAKRWSKWTRIEYGAAVIYLGLLLLGVSKVRMTSIAELVTVVMFSGAAVLGGGIYWLITYRRKAERVGKLGSKIIKMLSKGLRDDQMFERYRKLVALSIITASAVSFALIYTGPYLGLHRSIAGAVVFFGIEVIMAGVAMIVTPFVLSVFGRNTDSERLLVEDVTREVMTKVPDTVLDRFEWAPFGVSVKTGEVRGLLQLQRVMHVLAAGSAGSGKTTLMKVLVKHAIRHRLPVVVIDPKGQRSDIREIEAELGDEKGERFRLFSLVNLDESWAYNPLANGSAMEIKDRIMAAIEWSEPYYEAISARLLSFLLPLMKRFDMDVSIQTICQIIAAMMIPEPKLEKRAEINRSDGDGKTDVQAKVKACKKSREIIDPLFEEFKERLNSELELRLQQIEFGSLRRLGSEKLLGLYSQLMVLNGLEWRGKLSPSRKCNRQLDIVEAIRKGQIVYFQLNAMALGDTSYRVGKMILEDLKAIAAKIQTEQLKMEGYKFLPVFIDEFGSFATKNFVEFLKQCRSANFALHLFFQSMGDLETVSKEFVSQVMDNTIVKCYLRVDDPRTVEYCSSLIGTVEAEEETRQVGRGILGGSLETGTGTRKITQQMIVPHDTFKRLPIGRAVVVEKSPFRCDLVQLFQPGDFVRSLPSNQ